MINTVIKKEIKNKLSTENFLNDIYLLPKWEKINSFSIQENRFLLKKKLINAGLYRKFSSKNLLEKYSIKFDNGNLTANMDLKVYKDCVYIINLNAELLFCFNKLIEYLLQIAVEKALYNTSGKEVFINQESGSFREIRIKKILITNGFIPLTNQSELEKKIFGETFSLKIIKNPLWMNKIKENPILINK